MVRRQPTRHAQRKAFFRKHAGYAYDPRTESKRTGRNRTAARLARAIAAAEARGWTFHWEHDSEPYDPGDTDYQPSEVLGCVLRDADGNVLASLWGIADPDQNYGRVVEAELALEAMGR